MVPWQPPSTFGHTTKNRSVSIGAPGPMMPGHHPALGWPGPTGPDDVGVPGQGVEDEHGVAPAPASSSPQVS